MNKLGEETRKSLKLALAQAKMNDEIDALPDRVVEIMDEFQAAACELQAAAMSAAQLEENAAWHVQVAALARDSETARLHRRIAESARLALGRDLVTTLVGRVRQAARARRPRSRRTGTTPSRDPPDGDPDDEDDDLASDAWPGRFL